MKKVLIILIYCLVAQIADGQVNLTQGLVAYYSFAGNANDLSGHNHNGAVNGAMLTTDRFGNMNSAYRFNNPGDKITVPNHASLDGMTTGLTISFWIKLPVFSVGNNMIISKFSHCSGWSSGDAYNIRLNQAQRIWVQLSGNQSQLSSVAISDTNWHCITYVWDKPNSMIYIDGVPDVAGNYTTYNSNVSVGPEDLDFGTPTIDNCGQTHQYGETLDEIRIYDRALNQQEIDTLSSLITGINEAFFNRNVTVYPNPTIGNLSLDLGSRYTDVVVIVRNELGQEVYNHNFSTTNKLEFSIPGDAGIYFIELQADNNRAMLKAIKL